MADDASTLAEILAKQGVSRRGFLKFCAAMGSMMALPPSMTPAIAQALGTVRRPVVIWLESQACTGCTESLTRSFSPTLESLILSAISLDYHHTLMAPAGDAAERSRYEAMKSAQGNYLVMIDGSVPLGAGGAYATTSGHSYLDIVRETVEHAAAVINVGTCSAFGGLPVARPNPTEAVSVPELMAAGEIAEKPVVNVPGCPPIPAVITGVVAHYLTFGRIPPLDERNRPVSFYGDTIHDRCYRRPFYDQGLFAKTFDDEGARNGWCLYELGCKGPTTYNACATVKWNNGTSFPIESGHGCFGCSQPNFWDQGGFYRPLSTGDWGSAEGIAAAAAAGVALGVGAAAIARRRQRKWSETRGE